MRKITFTVDVLCNIPYSDEERYYKDAGILLLPDSYTDDGEPTRLVISCHGAGGVVSVNDSQVETLGLCKYLLANGYAVMDVNGLPQAYADEFQIDIMNNVGTPIAIQSYEKAYRYCMENYNFKKEVFVHGGSMGGISSTNLVLAGNVPVLAQSGHCPVLDTYNEIFLHPWSNGAPKVAMAKIYGFEMGEDDYIYDESKVNGCNPMNNSKVHPCPIFFAHCINDTMVDVEVTKQYIERAKSQGVDTELLIFPDGYHAPHEYGPPVPDPMGNVMLNGEKLLVKQADEWSFRWFKKYDK